MKKIVKIGLLLCILIIIMIVHSKNTYAENVSEEIDEVIELSFDGNDVNTSESLEIQEIEKFTSLEKLEICNYKLEDIHFLEKLSNLKELKMNYCQIKDIGVIKKLKNLTKLDLGYNQINDISPLKDLTKLTKLDLSVNQITDITPLKNLSKLTGINLSSNKIRDISVLSDMKDLALTQKKYDIKLLPVDIMKLLNFEYVYLDDNQISDLSALKEEVLKYTSVRRQRFSIKTNKKELQLKNTFLYGKNLELINCNLSEDKSKVILEDINQEAIIRVKESIFDESTVIIRYDESVPQFIVNYSETEATTNPVAVTISSNEEILPVDGWTLSENRMKLTKIYAKNITEKLNVSDIAGNQSDVTIEIKNIDIPVLDIKYSVINDVSEEKGKEIIAEADKYLGNPYRLSGDSLTDGIDCSHFVYRILKICGLYDGKYIRSTDWINIGKPVEDLEHAIAGDVIVWDGHVGFYDGYGKIVEAKGEKWGITHDRDAAKAIEKKTYMGIRRFTNDQKIETVINPNEITDKNVIVTISSSKKIKDVKGWKLSKDGKTLTKTYIKNANEVVKIKDYDGNKVETNINIVNINK